jgi:hydroxymethylbilane synthase
MSATSPVRIATRGSPLALAQANAVLALCQEAFPKVPFELRIIKTTGDKLQSASLADSNLPKGLFTKEIEDALLREEADLAVHSLKDLPTKLPEGLLLGATTPRAEVRDVLVFRDIEFAFAAGAVRAARQNRRAYRPALSVTALPTGAVAATSSTRRAAQLLERRPDLKLLPIRGNVGTRLRKLLEQSELDVLILAAAGLQRLGGKITPHGTLAGPDFPAGLGASLLPLSEMLPCVGQAAIGIEMRQDDARIEPICRALNHPDTRACVEAERAFLQGMGGGCQLAVAALAEIQNATLHLRAVSFLRSNPRRGEISGSPAGAAALGEQLAGQLR